MGKSGEVVGQIGAVTEVLQGPLWVELPEPPDIPPELPSVKATGVDAPLRWYQTEGGEGETVYGAVGGNSGVEGPYAVGVWVLGRDRYPTFEEWTSLAQQQCIAGAMLACSFVVGSQLIDAGDVGRVLFAVQQGCMANTPAAQRWALSNPGGVIHGQ